MAGRSSGFAAPSLHGRRGDEPEEARFRRQVDRNPHFRAGGRRLPAVHRFPIAGGCRRAGLDRIRWSGRAVKPRITAPGVSSGVSSRSTLSAWRGCVPAAYSAAFVRPSPSGSASASGTPGLVPTPVSHSSGRPSPSVSAPAMRFARPGVVRGNPPTSRRRRGAVLATRRSPGARKSTASINCRSASWSWRLSPAASRLNPAWSRPSPGWPSACQRRRAAR